MKVTVKVNMRAERTTPLMPNTLTFFIFYLTFYFIDYVKKQTQKKKELIKYHASQ